MVRPATLMRSLLCLALAVILLVPAAVSGAHSLSHGQAAFAAAGQHASVAGTTGHGDEMPDRRDGGHDHQVSLSVPVAILFADTPLVHPPLAMPAAPEMRVKRLAMRPTDPPPADPPRTA